MAISTPPSSEKPQGARCPGRITAHRSTRLRTNNLDMGIYKNFVIHERLKTQFRFETYNTFNHARFAAPHSDPTSPSFGVVGASQQNAPRTVQMALKISF